MLGAWLCWNVCEESRPISMTQRSRLLCNEAGSLKRSDADCEDLKSFASDLESVLGQYTSCLLLLRSSAERVRGSFRDDCGVLYG